MSELRSSKIVQTFKHLSFLPLRCLCLLAGFCLFPLFAVAQLSAYSSLRKTKFTTAKDSLFVDTLSIAPGSFNLPGIPDSAYDFFPQQSLLVWRHRPAVDSVVATYRVFPFQLNKKYAHKVFDNRRENTTLTYVPQYIPGGAKGAFVDFDQIEYNGSLGRTISLGNNQDVVLNSSLNIQANGYLLDSIKLEVALSDNSIPLQPEGNTKSIQEFDQVYIRLTKGKNLLQLGDFNLDKPKGYFLNFTKRVQGIYFGTEFKVAGNMRNAVGVSGSVAKGQFARNTFNGLEGNQGPYKLTGNNGEQFFIVLANTEKVYINGLIQERGEHADYTINYNTGELTFMPRRLITKDSRIQIEFEYQDRTFLNSLIFAWDELQVGKKLNVRLNAYSNQDARNQSYTQNLSPEQKFFLSNIGDSTQNAYYPLITPDTFSASKILYRLTDSVINGIPFDSVFVYSTNPAYQLYSLNFSNVGQGRGNYIIAATNANGRVYQWVAPVGGIRQGDYAPVQLLITPKKQQVVTLSTTYTIDSFKRLNVELGLSNRDPNLFSKIDNAAHTGYASKIQYSEQRFLGRKDSLKRAPWTLQNDVVYEYVQDKFRAIAPYRNVEFARDWNVPATDEGKPDEHLAGLTTSLANRRYGRVQYDFGFYQRGAQYTGFRNVAAYGYTNEHWNGAAIFNLTKAEDSLVRTHYFRPSVFAEYKFKRLLQTVAGMKYQAEDNRIKSTRNDSLNAAAYSFDITSAYLKTPESGKTRYGITYTLRRDKFPRAESFLQQSHSHTVDAQLGLAQWKNQRITFTGSFRQLVLDDTSFNNQQPEQTFLGRFEYVGDLLKRVIQLQTLYEFGSGQEQKRSYTYVEVPAGQGLYTWVDYNGDGVQQSNEFELALYPDQKKFIRIITATNEYVRANYVNYNQSITLDPANFWKNKPSPGIQKFISRFSDQASMQVSNRLLADQGANAYNPFINTLRNDNIISTATSISNTLYYNRTNTAWGVDYNYLHTNSKQLLTYGVEGSNNTQHAAKLRYNLNPSFTFNATGRSGIRGYQSALSDGRTYAIHSSAAEPSLTWLYRNTLRLTGLFNYENRMNEIAYGGEQARVARISLDMRYSKPTSGVILLRASYANITYNALTNTSVSYAMLDALLPGANFLWYANWQRRVTNGIEIALEYDGRKSAESKAVHTGKLTVRAIL